LDRYKIKHALLWLLLIFSILLFIFPGDARAANKGVNDQDLDITSGNEQGKGGGANQCGTGCHQIASPGSIGVTFNPAGPYTPSQAGINISVTTSGIGSGDDILGIALYNNASLPANIKTDGWSITADPNGNGIPYNYNQKTGLSTLDQTFSWNVSAPSTTGTYYMIAHARHAGANDYNVTSIVFTLTVQSAVPEFPFGGTLAFSLSAIIYTLIRKKMD
jgi:hypothetical protein